MAATSDWRLYQLYMEFGEAQDRRSRNNEAADAYALALYYARRLNDPARIQECRQLVLSRNPNHVAGQSVSAPLYFAQLLMRYPADEVEMMLTAGRQDHAAPSVAVAEEAPPSRPPNPERTFRQAQTIRPSFDEFARPAYHHAEPSFEGMSRPSVRPIIAEDVLLADAGLLDDVDSEDSRKGSNSGELSTAAKALAAGSIASGLLLVAYLGYNLYPVLHRLKAGKESPNQAVDSIVFKNEDDNLTPVKPSPPTQNPVSKPMPPPAAVVQAGANRPVKLPDEPPTKITANPATNDDSSRK